MESRRHALLLGIAGLACLATYAAVAWTNGFFAFADFDYLRDKAVIFYSFRQPQLASMLWKLLLLFPAALLLAAALVRSGVRLRMPCPRRDWQILVPVMTGAAVLIVLNIATVFRQTEVTDDENTYLFQARTLLLGRAVNPPPPVRSSFDNVFLINDGRQWTGKYNIGHPAVVALGVALGNRYAATVLLSVLTLLLVYGIAIHLGWDRRTAVLASCLGGISPFFYLVSSSLLSHTTSAFALAVFFVLLLIARNKAGEATAMPIALAAGLALGFGFNVRPLTAMGYALPFGILLASDLIRRRRGAPALVAASAAGLAVMIGATLWYNHAVTGNALLFPFNYYDPEERLGFGVFGHSPVMALNNLAVSVTRLNVFLFGFPLSLAFVAVLFAFRLTTGDRLAAGIVASLSFVYLFYWSPGVSDLGPVYYYELLVPMLLLSARGALQLHRWISLKAPNHAGFVPAFLVVSTTLSLLTFVPERLTHVRRLTDQVREPYETIKSADIQNALVMVRSLPLKGWVFGHRNPDPLLKDDVILCKYADRASNLAAMDAFPEREHYVMWFDHQWQHTALKRVTRADLMTMPAPRDD